MISSGLSLFNMFDLYEQRKKYQPPLSPPLREGVVFHEKDPSRALPPIRELFPLTHSFPFLEGAPGKGESTPLKIGVVFSGGQAAGGHNVIAGLYDRLQNRNPASELIGFLGGPSGIIEGKSKPLTKELVDEFRNVGGFHLIGSGRTKIETEEQLASSLSHIRGLDGLVVIGGDDSNTNAAVLAEYCLSKGAATRVVGVPKTIDGDLQNDHLAISFGFDTACKTYSELIGNIAFDALSAKKYTHFIKLMGRSASHIALQCALQTQPNYTLIGEEIAEKKQTLQEITAEIADLIEKRSSQGKCYGLVLIPEGTIEFIAEMKTLISELNTILAAGEGDPTSKLSAGAKNTFSFLPSKIQQQLLLDRDPHGNVQVSHIATEELFISTVKAELKRRGFKGKFDAVSHFFGYEGRSAFPTNFDANYCYALGFAASYLIEGGYTGYMSCIKGLDLPPSSWTPWGIPITSLMLLEKRKGKEKPVIEKALVDLKGALFQEFASKRESWALHDAYRCPGPIQFYGDKALTDHPPLFNR